MTSTVPAVLVTGGAGFIGSHTCVELLNAGRDVVVVDNLSNAHREALDAVRQLSAASGKTLHFHQVDVRDEQALDAVFARHSIDAVIHFAAFKAVNESVQKPLEYYDNNLGSLLTLLKVMRKHLVFSLVFSSSCTVYGMPEALPVTEQSRVGATLNPYGRSKFVAEEILRDVCAADARWRVLLLRYFNPTGCHASGLLGEDPSGPPNCLMPVVMRVLDGRLARLQVFGDDYDTSDGTAVRDYIHVVDVAIGHVAALAWLGKAGGGACEAINLGTGRGHTVLEVVHAMERASGRAIERVVAPRRAGDAAAIYCDAARAASELGWRATRSLDDMCVDCWRFVANRLAAARTTAGGST